MNRTPPPTPKELTQVQQTIALLEQPVRLCDIRHETILPLAQRMKNPALRYPQECDVKHGGCPHVWDLINDNFRDGYLTTLAREDGELMELQKAISDMACGLNAVDTDVRTARTGDQIVLQIENSQEEMDERAKPALVTYTAILQSPVFADLRQRAIAKLQRVLDAACDTVSACDV